MTSSRLANTRVPRIIARDRLAENFRCLRTRGVLNVCRSRCASDMIYSVGCHSPRKNIKYRSWCPLFCGASRSAWHNASGAQASQRGIRHRASAPDFFFKGAGGFGQRRRGLRTKAQGPPEARHRVGRGFFPDGRVWLWGRIVKE